MNKQIISMIFLMVACFGGCLMFLSCDRSLLMDNKPGITIRLQVPKPLEITTKASELDGITISNVWVLQYNAENNALLAAEMFEGNAIGSASQGVLEVSTSGFSEVESKFYVIANGGSDFISSAEKTTITEVALSAKTKAIVQGTTSQPTFLTSKPVKMTVESGGKVVVVAPLDRAFARVNLEWAKTNMNGDVKIRKVEVFSLPKNMATYTRGGGELGTNYPVLSSDNIYYTAKAIVDLDASTYPGGWGVGEKQTFYMAENLRGLGDGTTFAEKNKTGKGPGANGSLEGCTYVLLSGEYTYPEATAPIGVQYKIYLGGNLINDYNIQRGYSYDLKVNITGANSADVRVTITNGNVAVFDDVQSVTNEIEF